MKSWTAQKSLFSKYVNSVNTTVIAAGGESINDSIRTICNIRGGKLRFLEDTKSVYTVASQESYLIPNTFRKIIDMYIYSGTGTSSDSIYSPEIIFDPTKWKRIKQYRLGSGTVPYFVYVENQKFYLNPIPSATGNLITIRGRKNTRDLSIEDYTTGAIVSIANGATAVVGSGTTWTNDMVGRYIRITETSAANGGDGFWYEIGSFTDATHIGLLKNYEGTSIVAGSAAYTIGQMSAIPEAYDVAPVFRAAALYWDLQGELARGKSYWMKYDGGNEAGYSKDIGGLIGQMIENESETEEGSYLPPFGTQDNIISGAPYYFPFNDATGF
jgi:hypothetical protein